MISIREIKEKHDVLTLMVAAVAVLLTQFPPVYQWFYSADLDVRAEQSFSISPTAFNGISIGKYYSVTNDGEEPGRVKDVLLFILNEEGGLIHASHAQGYRLPGTKGFMREPEWEKFTELSLSPGQNWSHFISFNHSIDNYELDLVRSLQQEIEIEREDWETEMEMEGWSLDDYDPKMPEFDVSEELMGKLRSAIKDKMKWFEIGNYYLVEVSTTNSNPETIMYSFTISKKHIEFFSRSMRDLSYRSSANMGPSVIFKLASSSDRIPKEVLSELVKYSKAD